MRRSADRRSVYREIMDAAASLPEMALPVGAWARVESERLIAFLEVASPEIFADEAARLLAKDSGLATLSPAQKAAFFQIWERKGNRASLVQALLAHPDWQSEAWRFLAEEKASQNDYRAACEIARHFAEPPRLPSVESSGSRIELAMKFLIAPEDMASGLSLHELQVREDRFDDALGTLHKMQQVPHPPRYLWFMEADDHARQGDWVNAWKAWVEFNSRPGR